MQALHICRKRLLLPNNSHSQNLIRKGSQLLVASSSFPSAPAFSSTLIRSSQFRNYAMFSSLTSKISGALDSMFSKKTLTKQDIDFAMQKVKMALLAADVAEPVVKKFIKDVSDKITGMKVESNDQVPKAAFVYGQVLTGLQVVLGSEVSSLRVTPAKEGDPAVVMVVGIQGSGKTTTCAKLANAVTNKGKKVLLCSLDVRRPAAQEQLEIMAQQAGVDCLKRDSVSVLTTISATNEFGEKIEVPNPIEIAKQALERARSNKADVIIFDTAGRLHVDEELMKELGELNEIANPSETLLVADSMLGYDAVRIAKQFHDRVGVTGICMTRMDGDPKGGAAISMRSVTGIPIKFVGTGEKIPDLEIFDPRGMASRILGRGDLESLALKALESMSKEAREKQQQGIKNIMTGNFTYDDFLQQLRSLSKMGSLTSMIDYVPSAMLPIDKEKAKERLQSANADSQLKLYENIISAMTEEEKKNPLIIQTSSTKRHRLAQAAGVDMAAVNKLIKDFEKLQTQAKAGLGGMMGKMGGMFGGKQ